MRECGFYWLKFDNGYEIGYWNGRFWVLTDTENHFNDDYFDEIDEKQIKRE